MSIHSTKFLIGASAWALVAGSPGAALAADIDTATPVEEVLITGTLLGAGAGFVAPTPVTVLDSEQFQERAVGSVFEIIRDIPVFRGTTGPSANSTGAQNASKANLDLRGLGSNRTLVLINGRRHVADGQNNVFDSNLIPSSLIDHVDIVTGGASATYGSDAVAGVVNFVMKNRFEGLSVDSRFGFSQRGDNIEYNPSFAFGTSFADGRGHFVIGGDVTINNGTGNMYARDWGRLEPGQMSLPSTRAAGLPANLIANHVETASYNASGLIVSGPLAGIAFGDNGTFNALQFGSIVGGTEMIGTGNYGSVENPDQFLRAAYDRYALFSRAEFDLAPDLNVYAQAGYGSLSTYGRSFGARIPNFNRYPVQITNPFLPPAIVAAMQANNVTSFLYSASRHDDLGSISSRNKTYSFQSDIGMRGSIFGDWDWEVGGGIGEATFSPFIMNTPRTADFFHSAYVVAGPNGVPACGPVASDPYFNAQPAIVKATLIANLSPNCVPYNIFGTNLEQNRAANAYFNSASAADMDFSQYTLMANITGTPFALPAGDVLLAAGYGWRRDYSKVVNCVDCQKGALMNQNYSLYQGEIFVHEVYGELGVPVLKDMPFATALDLNAAVRHTNYSTSGGVTTWKVGATWDVNDMVRFRVTRSRDIRAPNINELFNPGSEGNPNVTNKATGGSGFIKSNTIGNPDLIPETSDAFTGGVVLQPAWEWASGFNVSVDYYNIRMKDVISTLGAQTILDDFVVKGSASPYAKYVTTDGTALGVSRVDVPQLNLNALRTDGVDVEVSYNFLLDSLEMPGAVDLRLLGSWRNHFRTITRTSDIDSAGTAATPKWVWNGLIAYSVERFRTSLMVRYTSPLTFDPTLIGLDGLTPGSAEYLARAKLSNSINRNKWPAAVYFNTSFAYTFLEDEEKTGEVYFNVDNLLDKKPPVVAISISGSPYDLVGRSFKLGVRFNY
jgi:iron complex outermembrane receptor protein